MWDCGLCEEWKSEPKACAPLHSQCNQSLGGRMLCQSSSRPVPNSSSDKTQTSCEPSRVDDAVKPTVCDRLGTGRRMRSGLIVEGRHQSCLPLDCGIRRCNARKLLELRYRIVCRPPEPYHAMLPLQEGDQLSEDLLAIFPTSTAISASKAAPLESPKRCWTCPRRAGKSLLMVHQQALRVASARGHPWKTSSSRRSLSRGLEVLLQLFNFIMQLKSFASPRYLAFSAASPPLMMTPRGYGCKQAQHFQQSRSRDGTAHHGAHKFVYLLPNGTSRVQEDQYFTPWERTMQARTHQPRNRRRMSSNPQHRKSEHKVPAQNPQSET